MFTLSLFLLLGVCGLAIDVGRMYMVKSETQSFTDAAALNAMVTLAGNQSGFTAAGTAASGTNKKWHFGYNFRYHRHRHIHCEPASRGEAGVGL
jgi:hypothetical protein